MPATINRSSSVERRIERYVAAACGRSGCRPPSWCAASSTSSGGRRSCGTGRPCGSCRRTSGSPTPRRAPRPTDTSGRSTAPASSPSRGSSLCWRRSARSGRFSTIYVQVTQHGHPFTGLHYYVTHGTPTVLYDGVVNSGNLYAVHQGVFPLLATFVLVVSCTACSPSTPWPSTSGGAVAPRRAVGRRGRAAMARGRGRRAPRGRPGRRPRHLGPAVGLRGPVDRRGLALRGGVGGPATGHRGVPAPVGPRRARPGARAGGAGGGARRGVAVGPFVADPHDMLHVVVEQPTFPNILGNHKTLWTPLAPHLSGSGTTDTVGGGPLRLVALVLAAGIGWWSQRWRQRHEMVVWGVALALALRVYTESVMTADDTWPALALGILVAARADVRRFVTVLVAAVVTLVVGQWSIDSYVWWAVQVVGVTVILVAAAAAPAAPGTGGTGPVDGTATSAPRPSGSRRPGADPWASAPGGAARPWCPDPAPGGTKLKSVLHSVRHVRLKPGGGPAWPRAKSCTQSTGSNIRTHVRRDRSSVPSSRRCATGRFVGRDRLRRDRHRAPHRVRPDHQ